MAISGNDIKRSSYGGQVDFDWYVSSQNGMNSTIKWTVTYSCPGCQWTDVNGNMYMEIRTKGVSDEIVLFTPADTRTVYPDGSFVERVFNESFIGTYWDSAKTPLCTKVVKTGTFTVTRDLDTNQSWFVVSIHGERNVESFSCRSVDYRWIDTYFPTATDLYGWSGDFYPSFGEIRGNVSTTTKYGSGAKINSVTWDNDEQDPVITYSYDKGSNVTSATLEACISFTGATDNIPYREISATGTSYTFPLTQEERNTLYTLLQNGDKATVRFYIKTTEIVGTETMVIPPQYVSHTFTFIEYKPVPHPTIVDINSATIALTGDPNKLIKYMSKASYDMNIELRKGALDVIGCYIQNGDKIEEGFETGVFDTPTSNTFYFSATDDRGYTGTAMYSLSSFDGEFIEYIKPTVTIKSQPITGEGNVTFTVSGKYFDKYFSATNKNEMSIRYKVYPVNEAAEWIDLGVIEPTIDGVDYSYVINEEDLEYTKAHTIEVEVSDKLLTVVATVKAVAKPVFYWSKDQFFFNVPVSINGQDVSSAEAGTATGYYMNSSGQYSSGGFTWNYLKHSNGLLECWCTVPVTTTVNTAWGNMYVAGTQYKTDVAYPVQPVETPLVMVTLGAGDTKGMLIADNSYVADTTATGRYNIASPVSITSNKTFRLNYYVRGRWK